MKIVCISASFIPANTANSIQVVKAAHALAELGHQVTLFVPGEKGAAWDALKTHYGVETPFSIRWIRENQAFKRYDFAFKAVHQARKLNPDLVYTWVLQAGVLALWQGIPTILEMHDRVTGRIGPWLFRRFYTSTTRRRLVTITDALRKVLILAFDLDTSKIEIIIAPDGVDLERYQDLPSPAEARKALAIPEGFTAGYTGHFYSGRGIELMFGLAKTMPEVQFLWVGGDQVDVTRWQNQLREEDVDNIILTGFVQNARLPQYQAAADVLLMPYGTTISGSGGGNTVDIASPMKMFEYMAAGRAILSSDLPVIHEVLDESTAVFCPPGDLAAWQRAITVLRSRPAQCHALGQNARAAVEAYTWRSRSERALAQFPGKISNHNV
jgi:glycosyltransferase involved in cell wall biosynthesis